MRAILPKLWIQPGWPLGIVLIVVLAILPLLGIPAVWVLYLFVFFNYLIMANMWNMLAGYSGLVFLGPAAFIGLAGYTMTIMTWLEIPFWVGMIAGAVIAALFAIIVSIPAFRMKGIYFAIGTLVVPEVLRYIFMMWKPVGGPLDGAGRGYSVHGVTDVSRAEIYWISLALAVVSIFLIRYILRSKLGNGLAAIRDNDKTAASCGINVFKLKLYSFVIAAFVTGLAGAIFYVYQGSIQPSGAFSVQWLVTIMLAAVIGGEGTEEGPVVGTAIVVFLYFLLARYAEISLIIQGVILVIIMLLAPQGIMGYLRGLGVYRSLLKFTYGR